MPETSWQYIIGRCWHTPGSLAIARQFCGPAEWPEDETQMEQWEACMRWVLAQRHKPENWHTALSMCFAGWECANHGLALSDVLAEEWATEKWQREARWRLSA